MDLSDKKLPDFNGHIKFWTTNLNISDEGLDCPLKLSVRIENHSNTPINDLIIKFKTPANISSFIDENNNYVKLFKHGRTILYIDDSFGIFGSNSENDSPPFTPVFPLKKQNLAQTWPRITPNKKGLCI